jgi:hypothetical protein
VSNFEEWSILEDGTRQSFPRADSFSPSCTLFSVEGMAQLGEWSMINNQGHTFPRAYSFSPGCTLFSDEGMAQIGEWSRLRNQGNYSFMLEKNSPDGSWMVFYFLRADALPDLTDVSGRMAQMT